MREMIKLRNLLLIYSCSLFLESLIMIFPLLLILSFLVNSDDPKLPSEHEVPLPFTHPYLIIYFFSSVVKLTMSVDILGRQVRVKQDKFSFWCSR